MKVLSIIWKVYDDRLEGFSDDKNGLIVVRDLCEYLGRKIESHLLLGQKYLPGLQLGNIHIVDSKSIKEKCDGMSHLEVMIKAFEKALMEIRPDIVHIHDPGEFCRMCMKICVERRIPYIFTAHSFVGKNQKITKMMERDIIWQREIYTTPGINIVAVGNGLVDKIITDYPQLKKEQLRVIQNGTDFKFEMVYSDLKSKLGYEGKKVLICPAKITRLKNQIQVVKAFQLLSKSVSEKVGVIFCGNDRLKGELQKEIKVAGLTNSMVYVGALNSMQMHLYYSISDGMILPSVTEGLSIAALESITYGLPLIMFSDIGCARDFNEDNISCLAKERTDQALAEAIEEWAIRDWDRDFIKEFAANFTMERVADEYIACYQDVIKKNRRY